MTWFAYLGLLAALVAVPISSHAAELQEVASFPAQQVTGVGVSQKSGRVFVNFPYWSDDHFLSVAEIVDGQPKPFPNEEWNQPGPAGSHFVSFVAQLQRAEDIRRFLRDCLWSSSPRSEKSSRLGGFA